MTSRVRIPSSAKILTATVVHTGTWSVGRKRIGTTRIIANVSNNPGCRTSYFLLLYYTYFTRSSADLLLLSGGES